MTWFSGMDKGLNEKMFQLLAITAIVANTIGVMANLVLYGANVPTVVCLCCDIYVVSVSIFGIRTKKTKIAALLLMSMLNFIEFPFLVYTYGMSSIPYMILGGAGVAIFWDDRIKKISLLIIGLYHSAVIVFACLTQSVFGEIEESGLVGTAVCCYLIVLAGVTSLIVIWSLENHVQQEMLTKLNKKLQIASDTDQLTNVYNRRFLWNFLRRKMEDDEEEFGVVLIDIDDFKCINDRFGHPFGDEVLLELCRIIQDNLKEGEILSRFGGEEFVIVLVKTDRPYIQNVLEKILDEFHHFGEKQKQELFSFSAGIEIFTGADEIEQLYQRMDRKLYQAKQNGKNCFQWE